MVLLQTRHKQVNVVGTLMALCQGQTAAQQVMLSSGTGMMYTGLLLLSRLFSATRCISTHPTAGIDVVQANGFQLEMCLCTWHISLAHSSDQHDVQADRADLAMLSNAQGKMERQGTSVPLRTTASICTVCPALLLFHLQSSALLSSAGTCFSPPWQSSRCMSKTRFLKTAQHSTPGIRDCMCTRQGHCCQACTAAH